MKNFFKKSAVFSAILIAIFITIGVTTPDSAHARAVSDCGTTFLGMKPWDCGINTSMGSEVDLTNNIVIIATNILSDITVIAAYLILGYIIYGGYLYMFSSGDPGKAINGKRTLSHAFIGLAIVASAYAIFGAIRIALIGNNSLGSCDITSGTTCVDDSTLVTNLIQWFIGMGGVVAAIFVVVGGWGYITAGGDPGKLQKAKTTILYALIGLIIVGLAEVFTAFISNLVREANDDTSFLDNQTIAININKETHEKI